MTKIQAYTFLTSCDRDIAWMANVFLTRGGPHCAKNLKAMVVLVKERNRLASLPYTMPTERVLVNGRAVTPEEMREIARR